jgi:hypothetical protein
MKIPLKKSNPLRIQAGAQKAELAHAKATAEQLKAQLATTEKRLKTGWAKTAAHLRARYGVELPLGADGCPPAAVLADALDELDGFFVRQAQLAEEQASALGFPVEKTSERLGQSFAACFKPKP